VDRVIEGFVIGLFVDGLCHCSAPFNNRLETDLQTRSLRSLASPVQSLKR
jgi:hypothetical protein